MAKTEIKIGGFGGQGVILTGFIIGKAASIFDGKDATMTQAFGPEARGSACSAQVIVSDGTILYPYVKRPQVMVIMSYNGGWVDRLIMLITDSFITIPVLPILITLGTLVRGRSSFLNVGLILVFFGWAWNARTVRAMALSGREREFINMARSSGASMLHIITREVFPYGYAYMVIGFINTILYAINTAAALAVIGLSNVTVHTLGSIIFWALNYNAMLTGQYPWIVAPVVATVLLFLGLFLTSTGYNELFAARRQSCPDRAARLRTRRHD